MRLSKQQKFLIATLYDHRLPLEYRKLMRLLMGFRLTDVATHALRSSFSRSLKRLEQQHLLKIYHSTWFTTGFYGGSGKVIRLDDFGLYMGDILARGGSVSPETAGDEAS